MPKKGIKTRGNGTGSAIRVKTGNWKAIAVVGYIDGRPVRRTKSGFKTKTEALQYIPILKGEKKEKKTSLTFADAYNEWLKTTTVSDLTLRTYKNAFKGLKQFHSVPLGAMDIDELQDHFDGLGLSYSSKHIAKTLLNQVFKWAIPRGFVPDKVNVAEFLRIHGSSSKSPRIAFTEDQLSRLQSHADEDLMSRYILIHCYLGFRPTAFLSLQRGDYHEDGYFVGGIKTEAGKERIVTVSPKIQPYVDQCLAECGDGYVFGNQGKPMSINVYRTRFKECMDKYGFEGLTPHSCRHTFATLMKKVQAPDKDKLELIGHTKESMLLYYQDVNIEDLKKITDAL